MTTRLEAGVEQTPNKAAPPDAVHVGHIVINSDGCYCKRTRYIDSGSCKLSKCVSTIAN